MGIKAATTGLLGAAGNAMAPDKPNEAAIGAAADRNAGIATQMQGIADQQKDLFAEFRPVLQDLITKNVTAQDLSTQRSNDAWASYTNTWKPVGEALAQKSLDWASPGRAAQEAQTAATGVAGQYDQARASSREAMIRAGMDPTAMASLESAGRLVEAKDTAGAANTARRSVEKEGMTYLDNAARFGNTVAGLSLDQARMAQTQGQGVAASVANLSSAANTPLVPLNAAVSANNSTVANQVGLFNAKSNQTNDRNAVIGDVVGAGLSAIGSAGGWQNFFKP